MLFPPPPVPPAPAKFLLTHEITMFSQLVNEFIVSLAGIFAALLWLNPGKSAAIRYAMILVPAGVLYTILTRESQGWQYMVLTHVNYSALAILFLLGVYMLKCPWRRVVLSFGIYSLVCTGLGIGIQFLDLAQYQESALGIVANESFEYAYAWLFVWMCSRKSEQGGAWSTLLAAGALLASIGVVYFNLRGAGVPYGYLFCVRPVICLLCMLFILRFVLQQAWKRVIITSALYALPLFLSVYLMRVFIELA